jgi:flagellar hook protein FlgE
MSLYGALFSGVSGLNAQSSAMGAISDNIANVNTVGYKGTTVNFQTLVTHQTSSTEYSPGGVQSKPRAGVDVQGLLQSTSSSTDIAISGSGFFVVNSDNSPSTSGKGEFAYTRAGSFKVDKDGYLQNTSGWYMQGWPLMNWDGTATASHMTIGNSTFMKAYKDTTGSLTYINDGVVNPTNLQSMNLNDIAGTAQPTTAIRMGANLPSSDSVGTTHQTNALMYDSLGNDHNVLMTWNKVGQNQWSLESDPPEGASTLQLNDAKGNLYQTMGRLDFTKVPSSGQFHMSINGNSYSFTAASGTSGTNGNDFFANPTAANGSPAIFAQALAGEVQQAYLTEYCGKTVNAAASMTGAPGNTTFTTGNLTITGPLGSSGAFSLAGQTLATAATTIDTQYSTTGVHCWVNNGQLAFYTDRAGTVTLDGGAAASDVKNAFGDATAGTAKTFVGTGDTYARQISGTGSVVFSNFDQANGVTVSGLTSVLTGTPPGSQTIAPSVVNVAPAPNTFASPSTVTITGPLGTWASADLSALTPTATLAQAITTINSKTGTTGVGAYVDTSGNVAYYTTVPGHVSISGTGDWTTGPYTFTNNGAKAIEQAYAPTNPDTFSLSKVAATVYSGTQSTTANGPNTPVIMFNGDGTPSAINITSMAITWANGSQNQNTAGAIGVSPPINMFLGDLNVSDGMTQLSGNYQLSYMSQNGAKFGNFSGVSVGEDGMVTALFDNGVTRPVFQIPVATFVNPNGMSSLTGNTFISTDFSGEATLRSPGDSGSGKTTGGSLEASTVDIGTQFTTMIITQRAYSAAAKIITTADQMLDDLINIKR